jgi:hypothetical protein
LTSDGQPLHVCPRCGRASEKRSELPPACRRLALALHPLDVVHYHFPRVRVYRDANGKQQSIQGETHD